MESERGRNPVPPLSLLSPVINCCDITLGDMLIFKPVFAEIKDS